MKFQHLLLMLLIAGVLISSCKKEIDEVMLFGKRNAEADISYEQAAGLPVKTLSADITSNTIWSRDTVYEIGGIVTVRNNATLSIQPGTYIKSTINTIGVANGVLVVAKDGHIHAIGNGENPIVFTSRYLLDGNASTTGSPGDFGGVVILGNAITNSPGGESSIEGLPDKPQFHYGGKDNADDRGILSYVRIEYAGFKYLLNDEVNGLTLGAVGSGTTIDHVQVSYGMDDGFEFFGGTVNPSYLVALGSNDDQFDFDNGYTGRIQHALAIADKNSAHSKDDNDSGSNGIEADNGTITNGSVPVTRPVLLNFSIIGTSGNAVPDGGYKDGVLLRSGAEMELGNSIVTGYPKGIVNQSPSKSTLINVSIHGFDQQILGGFKSTGVFIGVSNPASTFNIRQPWFNETESMGPLDLRSISGSRGGLTSDNAVWTEGWTNFKY